MGSRHGIATHRKPQAAVPLAITAMAGVLLVLATDTMAQEQPSDRTWTVTCGLPQDVHHPLLELLPVGGYTGPWRGDPDSGHLQAKTLNRPNGEGGITSEMWLLSRSIGWWKLKSMWVHPDDLDKLTDNLLGNGSLTEIRQCIDSPFLARPVVVPGGDAEDEEVVNGQILALLPDASRLRCAPPGGDRPDHGFKVDPVPGGAGDLPGPAGGEHEKLERGVRGCAGGDLDRQARDWPAAAPADR